MGESFPLQGSLSLEITWGNSVVSACRAGIPSAVQKQMTQEGFSSLFLVLSKKNQISYLKGFSTY